MRVGTEVSVKRATVVLCVLSACGSRELSATPSAFAFGEVNFGTERPAEGYSARDLVLINSGERPLTIELLDVDDVHLFITAPRFAHTAPPTLPALAAGDSTVLRVGIRDYALGELTSTIEGRFVVAAQGVDPQAIEWSFTAIRHNVVDTASP